MAVLGIILIVLTVGFLWVMFEGNIRHALLAVVVLIVVGAALDQAGFNSSSNPYSDEHLH